MSRTYPERPQIGVLALVRRSGRWLLVERGNEPNRGRWGFPGGVQELGETVVEAARRELAEETGVEAAGGRVLTVLDAIDRDTTGRVRYHFTLVAVVLDWVAGEGAAADDAAALGWFAADELGHLPVLPTVFELLRQAGAAQAG